MKGKSYANCCSTSLNLLLNQVSRKNYFAELQNYVLNKMYTKIWAVVAIILRSIISSPT